MLDIWEPESPLQNDDAASCGFVLGRRALTDSCSIDYPEM
jgi:hypothetical protein